MSGAGAGNISGIEVEQAICAHPAVLECAVIGIPHPHWGERTTSAPASSSFGPLPKTSAGKIQKFVLRQRESADVIPRLG